MGIVWKAHQAAAKRILWGCCTGRERGRVRQGKETRWKVSVMPSRAVMSTLESNGFQSEE